MTDLITTLQGQATDSFFGNVVVSWREKLVAALAEYRCFGQEVTDLKRKFGEAETDEAKALQDHTSHEDEVGKRISEAQVRKSIFESRIAAKNVQLSESLKRLENLFPFGEGELRLSCAEELERRRGILKKRLLTAIGLVENPIGLHGLSELIEVSPLVQVIRSCQPDLNVFSSRSIEAKASDVLSKFEKLETEGAKVI
jgi:hypothetical protein